MPYYIAIYDFSLFTMPAALSQANIDGDTHANDPAHVDYNSGAPTWVGETYTYDGGPSTLLAIDDDDGNFQDAYVETGTPQLLSQDTVINGTTYLAGSTVENEFGLVDGAGNEVWVVRIDGVNVGFAYASGTAPDPGDSFTPVNGRDGDATDSGDGVASEEPYANIVCFTAGALIATPFGLRNIDSLKSGDLVSTVDDGPAPVRWVSRRTVHFSSVNDNALPIEIKAGALGPGVPARDMVVSPQHRFAMWDMSNRQQGLMLVPAKALLALPRVRVQEGRQRVTYIHIALDRHQLLRAEGALTESCYVGPALINGANRADLLRMRAIFPTVDLGRSTGYGPHARPLLRVRDARRRIEAGLMGYIDVAHALEMVG